MRRAVPLGLAALTLAAGAWHVAVNAAPPAWDDAWYLEVSFRLFRALAQGPVAFAREYAAAFGIKPPLIAVAPLPLYILFGAGERLAVWVSWLCFAGTVWLVHRLGERLYGRGAGPCAAAVLCLLPLSYGLSRLFLVESLLSLLVCWLQLRLLDPEPKSERAAAAAGAAAGLGLLAKIIFPLYVAAAVWRRRKALWRYRWWAAAPALALASTWYAFNGPLAAGFALSAGFGPVGRHYGSSLAHYASTVGRDALSWPVLLSLCGVLLLCGRPRLLDGDRTALGWLLVPLAFFTVGANKDVRFLAPALPTLALMAGARVELLLRRPRGAWLAAALALPGLVVFAGQTFGPASALTYSGAPGGPGWDRRAALALLDGSDERAVVAVAYEHRHLNANNLASLAAASGRGWRFVSLGYAQPSAEGALIRLKDKGATHLLVVEGADPPDLPHFLNQANRGLSDALASGRLRASLLGRAPAAEGIVVAAYRL